MATQPGLAEGVFKKTLHVVRWGYSGLLKHPPTAANRDERAEYKKVIEEHFAKVFSGSYSDCVRTSLYAQTRHCEASVRIWLGLAD